MSRRQYASEPAPWWTQRGQGETWLWANGYHMAPLPKAIDREGDFDLTHTRRLREIAVMFEEVR